MGLNSTEIPYQFGQFGSTFLTGDGAKLVLTASTAKYYINAIQFITATQFHALESLDGGIDLGMGNTHFISSEAGTVDTDWAGKTVNDQTVTNESNDNADPIAIDGSGTTFPAGMTIYGMWDNVELHAGSCIVYVAPRPDYRTRA